MCGWDVRFWIAEFLTAYSQEVPFAPNMKSLQMSKVQFCGGPRFQANSRNGRTRVVYNRSVVDSENVADPIYDGDLAWYLR